MIAHQPSPGSPIWALIAEAESSETSSSRLTELAVHRSAWVRDAVSSNPRTPDAAILLQVEYPGSRSWGWSEGLAGRPNLESFLVASPDSDVRLALAQAYEPDGGALLRQTQDALARDASADVRAAIAARTTHRELFEGLMVDQDPTVRARCASNPLATRDDMERLISDQSRIVRARSVAFGRTFPDTEQLDRLASDRSVEVRWQVILSTRVSDSALRTLALDVDEDNARHARTLLDGRSARGDDAQPHPEDKN